MATGTVKWFKTTEGFGFIQPDDGSDDVFVHINAVQRSGIAYLNEGQKVGFEVEPGCNPISSRRSMFRPFDLGRRRVRRRERRRAGVRLKTS